MYQILTQIFRDREVRVVRHPLSPGRKGPQEDGVVETFPPPASDTTAPQGTGGGGGPSSPGSENPDLDDTFEFGMAPQRKKQTVFHRKARESLRRAGEVAEDYDPTPGNWLFLTGTLPGSTIAAFNALAGESGFVVKRLKDWLRKYCPLDVGFYCWERQKRGALHLHYCVHVPSSEKRDEICTKFKDHWVGTLFKVSERSGVDVFYRSGGYSHAQNPSVVQAYCQEVKFSVGRYLAKYCSKNHGKNTERCAEFLDSPRRWWGSSQILKDLVESSTNVLKYTCTTWMQARNLYARIKDGLVNAIYPAIVYESNGRDCDTTSLSIYSEAKLKLMKKTVEDICNQSRKPSIAQLIPVSPEESSLRVSIRDLSIRTAQTIKSMPITSRDLTKLHGDFMNFSGTLDPGNSLSRSEFWTIQDNLREMYRISLKYSSFSTVLSVKETGTQLQRLLSTWSRLLPGILRYSTYPLAKKIKFCNKIDLSLLTPDP